MRNILNSTLQEIITLWMILSIAKLWQIPPSWVKIKSLKLFKNRAIMDILDQSRCLPLWFMLREVFKMQLEIKEEGFFKIIMGFVLIDNYKIQVKFRNFIFCGSLNNKKIFTCINKQLFVWNWNPRLNKSIRYNHI